MIYLRENLLLEELFNTVYSPLAEGGRRPKFAGIETTYGVYGVDGEQYQKQGTVILDAGFLVDHMRLRIAFISDSGTAAVFEKYLELSWRKAEAWAEINLHDRMERPSLESLGFEFQELK